MMKFLLFPTFIIAFISCNNSPNKQDKNDSVNNFVQLLKDSLHIHPDSTGLRMQLMYALDSTGDYKNALAQADSLIMKDSLNYGLWFAKGEVAADGGDTSTAIISYRYAANIYQSPDALLSLANLYAEQKNDTCIVLCNKVRTLNMGREYEAHCSFITGIYYARTKNKTKAIQYFDECIKANYTYMEAYIEKGLAYFDEGNYTAALAVFNLAATINNLYADAYYYQARCYEEMNKKDSAVMRFRQSLQLDTTLKEARIHLHKLGTQ